VVEFEEAKGGGGALWLEPQRGVQSPPNAAAFGPCDAPGIFYWLSIARMIFAPKS
jgi:hypothetical protein